MKKALVAGFSIAVLTGCVSAPDFDENLIVFDPMTAISQEMSLSEVQRIIPGELGDDMNASELYRSGVANEKNIKYSSDYNPYAEIGKSYYEFDDDRLTGVYFVNIQSELQDELRDGEGLFGASRAQVREKYRVSYKHFRKEVGEPEGTVDLYQAGEFGMGIGAVGESGGFYLGLDKVGTLYATVETENGFFTHSFQTQRGVFTNSIRSALIILSFKNKDDLLDFNIE